MRNPGATSVRERSLGRSRGLTAAPQPKEHPVKYDEEVLSWIGSTPHGLGLVVFQPHLDPDLTAIGLHTPDNRRWELDADSARDLARLLDASAIELERILREIREHPDERDA
jgi:hypothetical protein